MTNFSLSQKRIWICGHRGLVGSALCRAIEQKFPQAHILTASRQDVDLTNRTEIDHYLYKQKPDAIFLAAGKVGGILANSQYPAQFLYDNLMIAANVIDAAHKYNIEKLLYFGSSCIYPRECPQPMTEDMLLSGSLEPTNRAYAMAKLSGIEMCRAYHTEYKARFISCLPTNLYGPGDNYHPEHSHVVPALIRRFYEQKTNNAPTLTLWGSGKAIRDFMHVDDLAEAAIFLMEHYEGSLPINIGSGQGTSITALAEHLRKISGYQGDILFNTDKPDGMPVKIQDVTRIHTMGWRHRISLQDGLKRTYQEYISMNQQSA